MLNNIHSLLRSTHCSQFGILCLLFYGEVVFAVFLQGMYPVLYNLLFSFDIFVLAYFPFRVCRSTLFSVITTFWFHRMGVPYFMDGFSLNKHLGCFWFFVITPNAVCENYAQVKTNSLKQRRGIFEVKHIYTHLQF